MNQELTNRNQIPELPQEINQELDLAISQTDRDLGSSDIGASVGVVTLDGKWTGATGVSNLETGQATESDDLFNIGSISKSYTSAVILKLQEQGILSLDDTLGQWLPDIAAEIPNSENLTIRQILNGTGGIWDYLNGDERFISDLAADYASGSNAERSPEDLVAYAFGKPLYTGGRSTEHWTYSNTGNVIAALIAEEATGKPFKQILAEEIVEPLGLENTFFTTEDVSLEQRARGYEDILAANGNLEQDGELEDTSFLNTEIAYGAGSIVSTSEDVAIFFDSLASGELLSPESTAEIFNYVDTGFERDNLEFSLEQFGLGVFPKNYPWSETRSMNGGLPGYTSSVDYFLNDDTTISVLVNQGQRSELVRRVYTTSVANALGLDDDSAINGTEDDDYLAGTSNNDIINGFESNDTLQGKEGLDALDGGVGNDLIEGSLGDDILFGKEGEDNLYGGEDNDFLNGGVDNDRLYGDAGDDSLVGGEGDDTLDGGADSDVIDGGAGNDKLTDTEGSNSLYGNDGDDLLFAGMDDDTLYGDAGSDILHSDAGNDQLFGGVGDDELNGGEGDDNLFGGEGNDIIGGLSGNDTLAGDAGSDRFIISTEGTDIVTDFTPDEDLLELPGNIGFGDLEVIQGQEDNAANTLVNFESETLAILNDINAANISQSDLV